MNEQIVKIVFERSMDRVVDAGGIFVDDLSGAKCWSGPVVGPVVLVLVVKRICVFSQLSGLILCLGLSLRLRRSNNWTAVRTKQNGTEQID